MHYDLYGNSYKTRIEAENAEMAQCAAIDADLAYRKVQELESKLYAKQQDQARESDPEYRIHTLEQQVAHLFAVIENLSSRINHLETSVPATK